jgi:bifunctional non-homologous end joining protein LigD
MLRPPVEVLRPTAVRTVPAADALPGGVQYSVKLDGFRCAAFSLDGRAFLQSREGNNLAGRFPPLAEAVATLPVGTVLDGEICVVVDGLFRFDQLQLAPRRRDPAGHLAYVAFDALALPGRDLRSLPLSQRWNALGAVVDHAPPSIQRITATVDRGEAVAWYDALTAVGVEGLVCKGLADRYRPGVRWLKIRHSETQDAKLVGVIGRPSRPRAVVAQLDDGRVEVTSPALDSLQARHLADAIRGLNGDDVLDSNLGSMHLVEDGPMVELAVGTGRHGTVRFVRVRGD